MSPGRMEIPRFLRTMISCCLEVEVDAMVEGRRRTEILVVDGACLARATSTALPNSPAPRTRMFDDIVC